MVKLLGDDPVDGTPELPDQLGRERYAMEIVRLLDRVRDDSHSSVIALVGSWGAGKTSVLDMVAGKLTSSEREFKWLTASFNPWMYSTVQAMQVAFFAELHAALPKDVRWKTARDRLGEFGKKLAPLGALVPGVDVSSVVTLASDVLLGDTGIAETKKRAEESLRNVASPMLVIIDDLDRLTPEELLFVFKLIRLVGRLPNIYYLLCYDERTMLDVLSRTDLVGSSNAERTTPSRARDYLEKIVQVRLDLPVFREHQQLAMINRALDFVTSKNGAMVDDAGTQRLQMAFSTHLQERLSTPRAINRFFGQVDALYGLIGQEVDFVDFMLMTWLRTAEPMVYAILPRYRSELTGFGGKLRVGGREQTHAQSLEIWKGELRNAEVTEANLDGVLEVLAMLFIPIKSATDGMEYGNTWLKEIADRRGVGSIDYFDRYFSFGVPEEDIPDATVAAALEALSAGRRDAPEVMFLASALSSETGLVCRKISSLLKKDQNAPVAAVITLMLAAYSSNSVPVSTWLSPRRTLEVFAIEFLPRLTADDGTELLLRLGQDADGLYFITNLVARASHNSNPGSGDGPVVPWIGNVRSGVGDLIQKRLDEVRHASLEVISEEDWHLVWSWYHIDHPRWTAWYRGQLSEGWSLIDLVAKLVRDDWRTGSSPFPVLDMGSVNSLLNLEYVLESLAEDLASAPVPFPQPASVGPWEERRLMAIALLRRWAVKGNGASDAER